jgi:hypothetical protein
MTYERVFSILLLFVSSLLSISYGLNAECSYNVEGDCLTGSTWWVDDACPEGYVCAEATCYTPGRPFLCNGGGPGYTVGCYDPNLPELGCPCRYSWQCDLAR